MLIDIHVQLANGRPNIGLRGLLVERLDERMPKLRGKLRLWRGLANSGRNRATRRSARRVEQQQNVRLQRDFKQGRLFATMLLREIAPIRCPFATR